MDRKELVKAFKDIMFEPKERFEDADFKVNHLVPSEIEVNDDFSRTYYFNYEVFGFDADMIEECEDDWDGTFKNLRKSLMKIDEVCSVEDNGTGISIRCM